MGRTDEVRQDTVTPASGPWAAADWLALARTARLEPSRPLRADAFGLAESGQAFEDHGHALAAADAHRF